MCDYHENLYRQDLALITGTPALELSISTQYFDIILKDHSTSESIIERIDDLQSNLTNRKGM